MLKLCGSSNFEPLEIIFNQCLETGVFTSEWKKGDVAPIHKKGDNKINYRPVSLQPICGKILERLMLNEMFEFFTENKLISASQSGFKPGDSCINQLLSITDEIYSFFDEGLELRRAFLDISKTFDKVWHDGIISKLTQNGISGNLLNLLRDFLNERKQRVILKEQFSTLKNVSAGVPLGSILGPLLFLIYINHLTEGISSNARIFADDASLFSVTHDTQTSANNRKKDLERISNSATQWKINFNPDTTKQAQEVIFSRKLKKFILHYCLIMPVLPGHFPKTLGNYT